MQRETNEAPLYEGKIEEFMWYVENIDEARMEPGDLSFKISFYYFDNGVIISRQGFDNETLEVKIIGAKWCLQNNAGLSFDRTSISGWKRINKLVV